MTAYRVFLLCFVTCWKAGVGQEAGDIYIYIRMIIIQDYVLGGDQR